MKKNITLQTIVALSTLYAGTAFSQQDTVRVKTTTTETTTTTTPSTPRTYPDTVVKTVPVPVEAAPAPVEEDHRHDRAPLRRTEFGIRYYPTFSSLNLRTYDGQVVQGSLSMSNGYGVFLGHNFNRHVGVILEVDYNQISQKYRDRNLDRVVNINYLNIPVLLSLNTDKTCWVNWNFVAGPQFGLNVGSSVKTSGSNNADTVRAVVAVKEGDIGFAYGTGLEFALNKPHTVRLDVGFRGFYGLVDMNANQQTNNPDTYNIMVKAARRTYAAYIGLTFMF